MHSQRIISISDTSQIQDDKFVKCSFSGQIFTHACINQICDTNPFVCSKKLICKCQQIHIKCSLDGIKNLKSKFQKKYSKMYIQNLIQQKIEQQIRCYKNFLKDFADKYVRTIMKSNPYNQMARIVQQALQTGKGNLISGKNISQFCNIKTIYSQINDRFRQFHQQLNYLTLQIFSIEDNKNLRRNVLQPRKMHEQKLEIKSAIIKSKQNYNRLISFFPNKVKSLKVLFKASKYNFSMQKYYQICSKQQNTIIICLTNQNKIIGGYTPLHFFIQASNTKKQQYVADYSQSSFVFCVTTNDKFPLKNKQRAIYRWAQQKYIVFGLFFNICNNSNTVESSYINFDQNNYDSKGYINSKESNLKVNGNQTQYFTTRDWEVIKVQF